MKYKITRIVGFINLFVIIVLFLDSFALTPRVEYKEFNMIGIFNDKGKHDTYRSRSSSNLYLLTLDSKRIVLPYYIDLGLNYGDTLGIEKTRILNMNINILIKQNHRNRIINIGMFDAHGLLLKIVFILISIVSINGIFRIISFDGDEIPLIIGTCLLIFIIANYFKYY